MIKNVLSLSMLFLLFACGNSESGSNAVAQQESAQSMKQVVEDVNAATFSKMKEEAGDEAIVLDIRTPREWNGGIISGAVKLDFYGDDFRKELEKLPRDKKILVYCASGGRSKNAQQIMASLGFQEIYNLEGGMSGWLENGLPVVNQ
jgi:rhodanese-related sulfurtransferase